MTDQRIPAPPMTGAEVARANAAPHPPPTSRFYFTFGIGSALVQRYVVIEDVNSFQARRTMFEMFGERWAFEYSEWYWTHDRDGSVYEGGSQATKYRLSELPLPVDFIRENVPEAAL